MQKGKPRRTHGSVPARHGAVRRFFGLPPADRRLLIRAAFLVASFRLGLRFVPFKTLQRISSSVRAVPSHRVPPAVSRLSWAVAAAGRRIPGASCLTEALAMQFLLSRRGITSQVCIGVRKSPDGVFQAHAWVEREGAVIIGGPAEERYARLVAFGQADR